MNGVARFLGGLSAAQFLREHWQKRPLLVRDAVDPALPTLSAEELLGLACEDEVESRLVRQQENRWSLEHGPFSEEQLGELPDRDWTLLVSDLEEHVPFIMDLLTLIDFLPSWRVDDVMASLSAPGGSVGPHYDSYDVFLLQIQGRKRWQLSSNFDRDSLLDGDLRILSDFGAESEHLLEPGDLLYLPPNVAHYGVAQDEHPSSPCLTYSLGCRAPSARELLAQYATDSIERCPEHHHYADPQLSADAPKHRLDAAAVERATELLRQHLRLDEDTVADSLARLTTQPKALFADDDELEHDADGLVALSSLSSTSALVRRQGSRWLFRRQGTRHLLYVNGHRFDCGTDLQFAPSLCATRRVDASQIAQWNANEATSIVLRDLVIRGYLEPPPEAD